MQNYTDLKIWEKTHFYTRRVYETSMSFSKEELYSLANHLRRSASSESAIRAERCGKKSNQEPAHFLKIALGPANESA